jgi:hypothetical protein
MESTPREAVLHLAPAPRDDGRLRLIDVEGELDHTAVKRWDGCCEALWRMAQRESPSISVAVY